MPDGDERELLRPERHIGAHDLRLPGAGGRLVDLNDLDIVPRVQSRAPPTG
jgi:hypothetical protein